MISRSQKSELNELYFCGDLPEHMSQEERDYISSLDELWMQSLARLYGKIAKFDQGVSGQG